MRKFLKVAGSAVGLFLSLIIAVSVYMSCSSMKRADYEGYRKVRIEKSPRRKEGKFVNTIGVRPMMEGSFWGMMKEYFFGEQERVPEELLDVVKIDPASITGGGPEDLKVTWLGHSSSIVEIEGKIILLDPVLSGRPSPVFFAGPKRYHNGLPIKPEDLPSIDAVIISHDHYDHLDYDTVTRIYKKVRRFITPLGAGAYLEKWGVESDKITELDWWDETGVVPGINIAAAPAQHFSGRKIFDRDETLWASFAVMGKKRSLFYSGDTGYHKEFVDIGKKYGPFDITMMENGQYNERWQLVHMLPEQSLKAHREVKGKVMIPVHWAAYNLSLHDWFEPVERLLKAAEGSGALIATPRIGEPVVFGKEPPGRHWWKRE